MSAVSYVYTIRQVKPCLLNNSLAWRTTMTVIIVSTSLLRSLYAPRYCIQFAATSVLLLISVHPLVVVVVSQFNGTSTPFPLQENTKHLACFHHKKTQKSFSFPLLENTQKNLFAKTPFRNFHISASNPHHLPMGLLFYKFSFRSLSAPL